MMEDVLKVDVIVINLMYYFVVLQYDENKMSVLKVVVKGVGLIVLCICEFGVEYWVFILEVLLLVWVLYCYVEIGQ